MSLLDLINSVYLKLKSFDGIEISNITLSEPFSRVGAEELERKFGITFPKQLMDIYTMCSSSILFSWSDKDSVLD